MTCAQDESVKLVNPEQKKSEVKERDKEEKTVLMEKKNVSEIDYASLFFDRANFIKKIQTPVVKKEIINPEDYKVVIEWQVENGKRKVKLRNNKTSEEYTVTEGDRSGKIILIERGLLFYKFQINSTIIRVKR